MVCRVDSFSDDAALLLDTCKGTMASPFGHGTIVSPDGSLLLLLLLMDGLQSGWFSNDAALLLDTMSCKGTMASPTIHWACVYPHGKPIWPWGNFFSGWFTFLVAVVDGWFAEWMVQQ